MIQFIVFFAPALVATGLEECKDLKSCLTTYAKYLLLINIVFIGVLVLIYEHALIVFNTELFRADFSLKALAINTLLAYVLPIINKLITKNFKIEVKKRKK